MRLYVEGGGNVLEDMDCELVLGVEKESAMIVTETLINETVKRLHSDHCRR